MDLRPKGKAAGQPNQWRSRERTTWTGSPEGERVGARKSIEAASLLQILCNCGELLECSFQILHNICRNHFGIGEVGGVFEGFVF